MFKKYSMRTCFACLFFWNQMFEAQKARKTEKAFSFQRFDRFFIYHANEAIPEPDFSQNSILNA